MKRYNVTIWKASDKQKIMKAGKWYISGHTASFDYIIICDTEAEMWKNLYLGISDEDGVEVKVDGYGGIF